jgi:hypothetical protein
MGLLLLNGVLLNHSNLRKDQLLPHWAQRPSGIALLPRSETPDFPHNSSILMTREKVSVHQPSTLPSALLLLVKSP